MYTVTGNTYPHKAALRAAGLRWHPVAKAWATDDPEIYREGLRIMAEPAEPQAPAAGRRAPAPPAEDIRIEYPSRGATYCTEQYGVYRYDVWPRSSVLAGQQRRQFLASFPTLEEAQAQYPTASLCGCGYQKPYLGHLPGEDDPDPMSY